MSERRAIVSCRGPQPTSAYPHAHIHENLVWVTAQAGRDPDSGEMVAGGAEGQMTRAIGNLEAILEECGTALHNVICTQVMYVDAADLTAIDAVYQRLFPKPVPVRTNFGVGFLAAEPGTELARLQLDCVAEIP